MKFCQRVSIRPKRCGIYSRIAKRRQALHQSRPI
jgi:hypothetical protein